MERRHTPGPWEYVPSNENHGPYVANGWGAGDICDCYIMSKPSELAVCNGGTSKPIHMQHDEADANAQLIAASPDLLEALRGLLSIAGYEHMTDEELWDEHALGNGAAKPILEARAAIAKAEGRA